MYVPSPLSISALVILYSTALHVSALFHFASTIAVRPSSVRPTRNPARAAAPMRLEPDGSVLRLAALLLVVMEHIHDADVLPLRYL